MLIQHLQPSLFFVGLQDVEGIVLISQLLDLMPDRRISDVFDVAVFLGGVVALLGAFLKRPMKASSKANGSDHPRGVFQKRVVVQHAKKLGLNVSGTVEWIHQQAARSLVE